MVLISGSGSGVVEPIFFLNQSINLEAQVRGFVAGASQIGESGTK